MSTGPRRRTAVHAPEMGLNYTAIGATASPEVVSFPPPGFRAAEVRHRVGSGERRFDLAGRALMTWGALRGAGFDVVEIHAEPRAVSPRGTGPLFLEDGTPWITPGMIATITGGAEVAGPVKVVAVIDEPGRIGYVYGSRPGSAVCAERLLLLEHEPDDAVWLTVRSIWQQPGRSWTVAARSLDARQRRLDERLVRALHPTNAA